MARDELFRQSRCFRVTKLRTRIALRCGLVLVRPAGSTDRFVFYLRGHGVYRTHDLALFKFRREEPNGVSYLTPGYPVTPIVFLVLIVFMLVLLAGNNPTQAFLGVAVVALAHRFIYFVS